MAKAQNKRVELVVTDMNMANKESIELVRAFRALPEYQYTPMLLLTTEPRAGKKQSGKAAGATGSIVKPFNPLQLLKTVEKVLS